jgi:acetyl esterase/lipase
MRAHAFGAVLTTAVVAGALLGRPATAQQAPAQPTSAHPTYTSDGVVHVPAFDLPPSPLMSPQAVGVLKMRAAAKVPGLEAGGGIAVARQRIEAQLAGQVAATRARYPADVTPQTIGGVHTRVITPKGRAVDPERVLINLHGGAFMICADACALLESLPIASIGGFKVVSVDYRMAPEATFPAASEDVAAVYRELLKTYRPSQIGIYGCSAGGALSGEAAAWLPAHGLPAPGAIGIFGAGAGRTTGDSSYISGYVDGAFPPPPPPGSPPRPQPIRSYFDGADLKDPLVSPMLHLDVLAKFPPTLVITGTRAPDLSPAVFTHSQLIKAGAASQLIVGEGMPHCYIYQADLPEAQDAYRTIVDFFQKNLR